MTLWCKRTPLISSTFLNYSRSLEFLLKTIKTIVVLASLTLVGCQSYSPQRYTAMPDNLPALKGLPAVSIRVEPFVMATTFDATCRGVGDMTPPVNMTMQGYLQTALADELKVAGMYDGTNPKIRLSGTIDRFNFSSSKGLTNGEWNIGLSLASSNGKSMYASESYQFESAFEGGTACRRTAEALLPAVQNLVSKVIRSNDFSLLLKE